MRWDVLTSQITEPVTHDQVKTFMNYPAADTSQDTFIDSCIVVARKWLEKRTALSIVSKSYKAYFEREDAEAGWYELPFSPVLTTPVITSSMNGVSTTFQQVGMGKVRVMPDSVFGTTHIGGSSVPSYLEVIFQAGATNEEANNILLELVSIAFNNRAGSGGVSTGNIPYDLLQRIDSISENI
jgi:hypothetical protein